MSELTDRLRAAYKNGGLAVGDLWNLCDEAADELDRLRAENEKLHEDYRIQNDEICRLGDENENQAQTIREYARRLEVIWGWLRAREVSIGWGSEIPAFVAFEDDHPEAINWFDENGEPK